MDQLSSPSSYAAAAPVADQGAPSIPASAVGKFVKCGHALHMLCMLAMYNNGTKVAKGPLRGAGPAAAGHVTRGVSLAGRQPAVSLLQDHLRREDRDAAQGQDGDLQHRPGAAGTPRLWRHPDHLQHSARSAGTSAGGPRPASPRSDPGALPPPPPGSGASQPGTAIHLPGLPAFLLPPRQPQRQEGERRRRPAAAQRSHLHTSLRLLRCWSC